MVVVLLLVGRDCQRFVAILFKLFAAAAAVVVIVGNCYDHFEWLFMLFYDSLLLLFKWIKISRLKYYIYINNYFICYFEVRFFIFCNNRNEIKSEKIYYFFIRYSNLNIFMYAHKLIAWHLLLLGILLKSAKAVLREKLYNQLFKRVWKNTKMQSWMYLFETRR